MKGTQAISVTLLMSFLVLVTRGKDVRYRRQEEDNTHILTYRRVNKTIEMKDGDIYDCIDVNEQPAFDHPLLKDHKIQMKPSSFPVWPEMETLLSDSFSEVQPSTVECPIGTIPIMRTNISGSIETHNIDGLSNDQQWETAGLKFTGDVYGTRAILNIWEPKVNKGSKDYSAMWVEMRNGGGQQTDTLGAGFRVFPSLSGDTFVRFHIAWYDGLYKKSCIDYSCPGFVQVNNKIGPGSRILHASVYDGTQKIVGIQIFKDAVSKNWWVIYQNISIGYWHSALFEFLRNKGDSAFFGGFVEGPTAQSNSPQMGSGHFSSEGFGRAAYIKNIEIANERGGYFIPDPSHVEHGSSDRSKYSADRFEISKDGGMRIYYGGPGSNRA